MSAKSAFPLNSSRELYTAPSPPLEDYVWTELGATITAPSWLPGYHDGKRDEASAYAMQHLRFPTPPITPPRILATPVTPQTALNDAAANLDAPHTLRTQSVIVKAGACGSRPIAHQLEPAPFSAASSGSGSGRDSLSPSSDHLCEWLDCANFFDSLDALAAHVTQIHAVACLDGLYYCRWRGCQRRERGFNARYKMLVHARTHTKEKPHTCHLCAKSFSRAENLKIHIRSHSGEKPYVCIYAGCNKSYSNSSDRFKHTRTHAVCKPYVCKVPGCQKRYTDPSSLRKHVKTFKHAEQLLIVDDAPAHQPTAHFTAEPADRVIYEHYQLEDYYSTTTPLYSWPVEHCEPQASLSDAHSPPAVEMDVDLAESYAQHTTPLDLRLHRR